jgi:hypothetical protein
LIRRLDRIEMRPVNLDRHQSPFMIARIANQWSKSFPAIRYLGAAPVAIASLA